MTGLDTSQVRCLLCDSTDVEILDVDIWDSGLPQPNRLVRLGNDLREQIPEIPT